MADVAVPSIATGTPVSSDSVVGVQSGVVKRFPASPPFAQLAATTGANLLGYSAAEVYDANTVGAAIKAIGTGGGANLSYTAAPTNGVVVSDSGTDATLTLADGTNAGLMTPAQFTKLSNTSGTNTGDQTISLTGDVTGSGTGSFAATLATVNSNVGSFTNANITVNAKGLVTAASNGVGGSGGGDALTTNPLSQFAATTSAQLAGVISDETGSGALVFANSPTLVTPALGTPASGTLTNCTFPTLNQSTTGSAAKWTTARTLAGNSVDGSANVTFANKVIVQGTTDAGLSAAQFLGALATGIVKNTTTTGVLSIAVAADFPTLNQSTTGSAATLTTPRAIYGNNFDGSAALTQIIASGFGGTGNGFAKLSGPTTAEKTFTLPDASATILTSNAAVTVAQGGTGLGTLTTGNVILGAGTSTPTFVAPGTSGNVLTSNGSTWTSAAAAGGGAWTLLSTVTATGAATADIETTFSSTYDHYFLIVDGIHPSVDGDAIYARMKLGGAYDTAANYNYHLMRPTDGATAYVASASNGGPEAKIILAHSVGNAASLSARLTIQIDSPANTAIRKQIHWTGGYLTTTGVTTLAFGSAHNSGATTALTGFRIFASTGNITLTARLYGVTNT